MGSLMEALHLTVRCVNMVKVVFCNGGELCHILLLNTNSKSCVGRPTAAFDLA